MKRITVIYYHSIVEPGKGRSYQCVERQKFEEQMRWLRDNHYQSLLLDDLDKPLPHKGVLVVFDDGFRSVYDTAAKIMNQYGIKGNVFVPTYYVEQCHPRFMTWDMIKELCESQQFCVGAHTHRHVDIRNLDQAGMREEILLSSQLFEQHLGKKPKAFCMPYGKYDRRSIARLQNCENYRWLYASYYGQLGKATRRSLIPRVGISNDDSMVVFEKKMLGKLNWTGPLQRLRLLVENAVGKRVEVYEIE